MQLKLNHQETDQRRRPLHIRAPFITQPTGLGEAIAALTAAAGVKPCGGCKERAAALDKRVVLDPWAT